MTRHDPDQRTEVVAEQSPDQDVDTDHDIDTDANADTDVDGSNTASTADRTSESADEEAAAAPNVVIEVDGESERATDPAPFSVVVNGESVQIDTETTVGELGQVVDAGEDAVFTYRGEDGVEALSGDQTLSGVVAEGTELWTQPLGDGEVFGGR
jgi:hypothetical protein